MQRSSRKSFARRLVVTGVAIVGAWQVASAQQVAEAFKVSYRYNSLGEIAGVILPDPDGAGSLRYLASRNTYDSRGRLVLVEHGELAAYESDETPQGDVISPQDWNNFAVYQREIYTYDKLGRQLTAATADAVGVVHTMSQNSYDDESRVTCSAARMNPPAFNSLPPAACTLGPEGAFGPDRITRYTYDPDGYGAVTKEERAVGTPLQQVYVDYEYDADRRVIGITDANGNYTYQTYDASNRLKRMYFPSKATPGNYDASDYEEYTYDDNGNLTVLRKRDGRAIVYNYDDRNRVWRKYLPAGGGISVYYGYDHRGLQTYARYRSSYDAQGVANTFDGFGGLASSTNTGYSGVAHTLSYRYDLNGNRVRLTHPDGAYFTYTYDGLDRAEHVYEYGSTLVATYSYNAQGRRSGLTRTGGFGSAYDYDAIGRLDYISQNLSGLTGDVNYAFNYNPASQITSRTTSNNAYEYSNHVVGSDDYVVNGLNQYTSVDGLFYNYDQNANLTYDGSVSYAYDIGNRLTGASGAKNAALKYDPLGRLDEISGGATTTYFLYDGDALVAEYDSSGNLIKRYVHGSGIDNPLLDYSGSVVSSASRRNLYADHRGSITAVTDSSGSMIGINQYDSFGIPDPQNIGRFAYTGQILIPELDFYHYKARIYSPYIGRFLQTDPIGYDDQMNLYTYVGNDPVNIVDPTGMAGCSDMKEQNLTGNCIEASNFDPELAPNDRVIGSSEHDQAAIGVASSLEGPKEKGTTLDYSVEQETVVSGSTEQGTKTKGGQETPIQPNSDTEAVVHSHPNTKDYTIAPGFESNAKGDHVAVQRGYPNYIVRKGDVIVVENSNGQLRVRVIQGKLNATERKQVRQVLRKMQNVMHSL